MTQDNSYIRMKEAINEFWKTRQTFYNYIHKGQISTKKIHNKLYLSVRDIKRVLWNYIWEQYISNKNTEELNSEEMIQKADFQIVKNQVDHIESKLKYIPNEFSMYAQQMNQENRQYNDLATWKLEGYIKNIQWYMDTKLHNVGLSLKKYKFAVSYLFIILVNAFIVLILL